MRDTSRKDGGGRGASERRRAERRGRRGEGAAALWLQLKGYQILDRRARTPVGEIDIVARRGGVTVFVEVKARPERGAGLIAVSRSAQRRLSRAGAAWLAGRSQSTPMRFDVVVIAPRSLPFHLRDAWRPEPEEG